MQLKIEIYPDPTEKIDKELLKACLDKFLLSNYDVRTCKISIIGHDIKPEICPICGGELVTDYECMVKYRGYVFLDSIPWQEWTLTCNRCGEAGTYDELLDIA